MILLFSVWASVAVAAPAPLSTRIDAALADRHGVDCSQVIAMGARDEVRSALVAATRRELPPWAPLRAAECLTDMATDATSQAEVEALIRLPEQPGFALVVAPRLRALPEAPAVALARVLAERVSAETTLRTKVHQELRANPHPAVRAVVAVPGATVP